MVESASNQVRGGGGEREVRKMPSDGKEVRSEAKERIAPRRSCLNIVRDGWAEVERSSFLEVRRCRGPVEEGQCRRRIERRIAVAEGEGTVVVEEEDSRPLVGQRRQPEGVSGRQ